MEKINYREPELDWIDGLLTIVDSARRVLLALKQSRPERPKPTCQQQQVLGLLGVRYASNLTQRDAQRMIDFHCQRILESIVEWGDRPDKGRPFFFLRLGELPKDRGEWL